MKWLAPKSAPFVIQRPEWTPEDDALLRELAAMPHFKALEKKIDLRVADLNEQHIRTSDPKLAERMDENRILISEIKNTLIPRE